MIPEINGEKKNPPREKELVNILPGWTISSIWRNAFRGSKNSWFHSRNYRDDTLGWAQWFTHMSVYLSLVLLKNGKQSKCWTKEEFIELIQQLVNCFDHGLQLDVHCRGQCLYKWNQIIKKQNLALIHTRHRHFSPF